MFSLFEPNTSGTDSSSTSTEKPPSLYPTGTPNEFKGQNNGQKGTNNRQNKGTNNGKKGKNNRQNKQEEQSNFNPNNEGVFSIPIIKEFSNLNTKNIEIAEQEGMIGCNVC